MLPVVGQGGPANGRSAGKVSGVVLDAVTNAPVEYATVALLSPQDSSLVTGTVTNPQGQFLLEPVPAGTYRVRITYIGYRNAVKENLVVRPDAPVVDLGSIRIRPSSQALEEVVVTAERPLFEQSIDKRVFNVEKSIVSEGGSATDILETIPSVSVDVEGNVSLRGSGNVTILIDGKPSGLTGADRAAVLQQIPAASIERIEVVTNPSARYDAKACRASSTWCSRKTSGAASTARPAASAGTRHKYNGSLNLSYRTPKFNAYTNYSYRYNTRYGRGFSLRELAGLRFGPAAEIRREMRWTTTTWSGPASTTSPAPKPPWVVGGVPHQRRKGRRNDHQPRIRRRRAVGQPVLPAQRHPRSRRQRRPEPGLQADLRQARTGPFGGLSGTRTTPTTTRTCSLPGRTSTN
jgi:hypothetical protein